MTINKSRTVPNLVYCGQYYTIAANALCLNLNGSVRRTIINGIIYSHLWASAGRWAHTSCSQRAVALGADGRHIRRRPHYPRDSPTEPIHSAPNRPSPENTTPLETQPTIGYLYGAYPRFTSLARSLWTTSKVVVNVATRDDAGCWNRYPTSTLLLLLGQH